MSETPAPSPRTRLRRRPERGRYDEASLFAVLDAALVAHIGYLDEDQPMVTPTTFWREGRTLYWHGAAASRILARSGSGAPVCVTVTLLDGLIVGRSGIKHSVNYRSAMVFGRARLVTGLEAKRAAMAAFLERLYPGRTLELRPSSDVELAQIVVAEMEIAEASVKVKAGGPLPYAPDEGWPAWTGVIPIETRIGAPQPDPDLGVRAPGRGLSPYREGARLDEALAAAAQSGLPVSA
ncbi:pyridoxamine 5'-phosphate oxidase family protein [Phenylobacterium terrae]|uniref:Pyridoxamine 5'-phosphate oxidase family protein n=1 Tax=Phenylobacterium terrae TaxID=2665495 RepID=A0ABW4N252_9CAUL